MRGVLRLGIQKTLGVVQSHYRVNLMALAMGYIIPDGLDDDGAEAKANHLDALAAPATDILADDFMEILFQTLLLPDPSSPESSWALRPLDFGQNSGHAAHVINTIYLKCL
jgi:hypothetical protein